MNSTDACVLCVSLVSGNGGNVLVDGATEECTAVPVWPDGVSTQYELSINSTCGNGNDVIVLVTIDQEDDCKEME